MGGWMLGGSKAGELTSAPEVPRPVSTINLGIRFTAAKYVLLYVKK
jgi:hypothetical protein